MRPGLSDDDIERIAEFLETPAYERDPEMLMPESKSELDDRDDPR